MATLSKKNLGCLCIFLAAFGIFIKTAWISDDAAITLRCVMNALHGYGPVFNISERVQAFTHPLWFLILWFVAWLLKNVFYATFFVSIAASLIVFCLLLRQARSRHILNLLLVGCLLLSKAFIDYSTSGLENPLSHLMILLGFGFGFRFLETKNIKFAFFSVIILISTYLSRPDLIVLVSPFVIIVFLETPRQKKGKLILLAIVPVAIWTIFSLVYYGFPLPNTAYAKILNKFPQADLFRQGFEYIKDVCMHDPVSVMLILVSIVFGMKRSREIQAIILGIVAYVLYIIWIGGDFMSGRFFSVLVVAGIFILLRIPETSRLLKTIPLILCVGLLLFFVRQPGLTGKNVQLSGIADERNYYEQTSMLGKNSRPFSQPDWSLKEKWIRTSCGGMGYLGLYVGPSAHMIDLCALAEPFLARVPPRMDVFWRIGHFYRQIPTNYIQFMYTGDESYFLDHEALAYWKKIHVAVSGPIFSSERMKTILKLNLGLIRKPNFSAYQYGIIPAFIIDDRQFESMKPVETGESSDGSFNFIYSLLVQFHQPKKILSLDFSIDGDSEVTLMYESGNKYYPFLRLSPKTTMTRYKIPLDPGLPVISRILIVPSEYRVTHYLGHFHAK